MREGDGGRGREGVGKRGRGRGREGGKEETGRRMGLRLSGRQN